MCPPSRRQRRRRQGGSNRGVRAMSAYQANVKVEPPCVARSARTPGSIVASSTTSIKIAEAPPAPCSRMGPCTKRGHADYVGCSCLRQRAFRREPECEGAALGRCDSEPKLVRAQRLAAEYTETKIIKRQRRLSKCRYISSVTRYIPRI